MAMDKTEAPKTPPFVHGGYMVPEDQMLAIGAVICTAEDVCEIFDDTCEDAEDFVDSLTCYVMDLRKALRELKALKDGE